MGLLAACLGEFCRRRASSDLSGCCQSFGNRSKSSHSYGAILFRLACFLVLWSNLRDSSTSSVLGWKKRWRRRQRVCLLLFSSPFSFLDDRRPHILRQQLRMAGQTEIMKGGGGGESFPPVENAPLFGFEFRHHFFFFVVFKF